MNWLLRSREAKLTAGIKSERINVAEELNGEQRPEHERHVVVVLLDLTS